MNNIKDKLKKNSVIVTIYEIIFGRLNKFSYRTAKRIRWIKSRLTTRLHFCYGNKNKDKTFFVISSSAKEMGLYSTIFCIILPCIEYAVKRNYIPVIDLSKTYLPMLQDENKQGLENPWEYYYEQPFSQYTLEEVYQSKHIIMADTSLLRIRIPDWNEMFPANEKNLKYWNQLICSYIRLKSELENKVQAEQKRIFQDNRKVLGVGIRAGLRAGALRGGTMYNAHPKQPTCEELMAIVEDKMKEWKCDALFASFDDREYLDKFISYFGDRCLYMDRKLMHFFKNDIPVENIAETRIEIAEITVDKRTEEYIIETYNLAQCHCLYSCIGGGAEFAYFLNGGKYEHCEVYDEGYYTIISGNNDKGKDKMSGYKL